ncbi:MAG: hypothetical protein ACRDRN_06980 [Sciscionella sp.]
MSTFHGYSRGKYSRCDLVQAQREVDLKRPLRFLPGFAEQHTEESQIRGGRAMTGPAERQQRPQAAFRAPNWWRSSARHIAVAGTAC